MPILVMPVVVFLAAAGVGLRYPYILGGRWDAAVARAHPGFAALTRHPVLWALALWSAAHLPLSGDLAHILLFGGLRPVDLPLVEL